MTSSPFFIAGRIPLDTLPVATNAELLEAWGRAIRSRYRGSSVRTYTEAAEAFFRFLDSRHVAFGELSSQLLCDYLSSIAEKCSALGSMNGDHICKSRMFPPSRAIPATCGFECPRYQKVKVETYKCTEKALARLFEFASDETPLLPANIFPGVRKRMQVALKRRRLREREDTRYPRRALTNDEIAALFRVTHHPRDRLVLALMFKTGARHKEVLLLPDGPEVRAGWVETRLITVEGAHGVKRLGNPYLVIDDQLWGLFERYYGWKDETLRWAGPADARQRRLFLGKDGSRVMSIDSMATLWRAAGERAGIRVSAVSDAPLTPHSGRYTFVRLLEEAGFSPFWIARLRGDVQAPDPMLRAAWTYAKRSPEELRREYFSRFPRIVV